MDTFKIISQGFLPETSTMQYTVHFAAILLWQIFGGNSSVTFKSLMWSAKLSRRNRLLLLLLFAKSKGYSSYACISEYNNLLLISLNDTIYFSSSLLTAFIWGYVTIFSSEWLIYIHQLFLIICIWIDIYHNYIL